MAKYHINSNGEPGVCRAAAGGCPFGGEQDHFSSKEEAREAFEASRDSFAVVIKKPDETTGKPQRRAIETSDAQISAAVAEAEVEFTAAKNKQDWIEDKVDAMTRAQTAVERTHPGSPEREEALATRDEHRTRLLAADLVNWRNSSFYSEAVEEKMKRTAQVISAADSSLEAAISDDNEQAALASKFGLAKNDVARILEMTQAEYQRPRAPRSRPLDELAEDTGYATSTAYAFRIPAENVQEVIRFAAQYPARSTS